MGTWPAVLSREQQGWHPAGKPPHGSCCMQLRTARFKLCWPPATKPRACTRAALPVWKFATAGSATGYQGLTCDKSMRSMEDATASRAGAGLGSGPACKAKLGKGRAAAVREVGAGRACWGGQEGRFG